MTKDDYLHIFRTFWTEEGYAGIKAALRGSEAVPRSLSNGPDISLALAEGKLARNPYQFKMR